MLMRISPITTYEGQGVTAPGCNAAAHTAVCSEGEPPRILPDETTKGMTKAPLCINSHLYPLDSMSRLRFDRICRFDMSVQSTPYGRILSKHRARLLRYCAEFQEVIDLDGPYTAPDKHIPQRSKRTSRPRFQDESSAEIGGNESYPWQETESQRVERERAVSMRQDAPFGGLKPPYVQ
jgi:hypothetical protein